MTTCNLQKWNETPPYQEALENFLRSAAGKAFMEVWISQTPAAPPMIDNVNALHIAGRTAQHLADYQFIVRLTQKQKLGEEDGGVKSDFETDSILGE